MGEQPNQQMCSKGHIILKENCQACRSLKKEWYDYLSRAGFFDIETSTRIADHESSFDLFQKREFQSHDLFEAKLNYFQWARTMLFEGSFRSIRDQIVWEYHTEGLSRRQISARVGLEHSWCGRKVHRIRAYLKGDFRNQTESSGSMSSDHHAYLDEP